MEPVTRPPDPGAVTGGGDVVVVHRADKGLSSPYTAPRSDLETALVGLWAAQLRVEPIGVDDDFFELGGHSLMAAELLVDLQRELGLEVTARTLFLQPTVAELAAAISRETAGEGSR